MIKNNRDFDLLFVFLFSTDRVVSMRAADAIEKITVRFPEYLYQHKKEFMILCQSDIQKELKWHLALMLPRFIYTKAEVGEVVSILHDWAADKTNSRIVRVNSLQALFELTRMHPDFAKSLDKLINELELENIPSLNARIKKLRLQLAETSKRVRK